MPVFGTGDRGSIPLKGAAMSEDKSHSEPKKITRRQFISSAAAGGALGFLGGLALKINVIKAPTTSTSDAPPTNKPTPIPIETQTPVEIPITPISQLLQQTATAIAQNNEESSFREGGGFTQEIFEKIRRGTYVVNIFFEDKSTPATDGKGTGRVGRGTAWLAAVDKDSYYFVTNRHVAKQNEVSEINLWRPNVDQRKIVAKNFKITFYETVFDLAVIKCTGIHIPDETREVLNWRDNASLQKGDKLLIVGFPQEFYNLNSDMKHSTLGSIVTAAEPINGTRPLGITSGLTNFGSSGSPVVALSGKIPEVVGIAFANTNSAIIDGKRQPATLINTLAVQNLINKTNE